MVAQDFKSDQYVRFCPGCGDHAITAALQKAMAEIGVPTHMTAVISGIGCSSRMPHYINTYGFNTIHGRGAAIATGVKTSNPDLNVWLMTGDGDCLAIGGNHFIHCLRRNVDINIVLFNNRIYGLTKGQYSPTSPKGFVSKSSPYGTVERPFRPAELVMGARGTFFARALDADVNLTTSCMVAASRHQGAAVIECLTNCVIFNNGAHNWVSDRTTRADHTLLLEQDKPMLFGQNKERGLVLDEHMNLRVVTLGQDRVTLADILVHDAHCTDDTIHRKLALMEGPDMPTALGVIRDVEEETYDQAVARQIAEVKQKARIHCFDELVENCEKWEM